MTGSGYRSSTDHEATLHLVHLLAGLKRAGIGDVITSTDRIWYSLCVGYAVYEVCNDYSVCYSVMGCMFVCIGSQERIFGSCSPKAA